MTEETKDTPIEQPTEIPTQEVVEVPPVPVVVSGTTPSATENVGKQPKPFANFGRRSGGGGQNRGGGRDNRRHDGRKEEKPEFEQKLLDIRRTARMVAGGRRFNFRALVVIGNKKGKVGVGVAKGADVTIAVEKAVNQAKKVLIEVPITENKSISQMIEAKFGAARVMLKPAQKGRGIIAGGAVRVICNLSGIENVVSKIIGRTTNKLNNAQATIEALKKL
ncbi:MAG: 30S ribosomal protein S5 [Candidatus Portnoybacteria bacterium]|nr:30S ribosomal protein S5 [Candidatus Portnoybacteria bacterium]